MRCKVHACTWLRSQRCAHGGRDSTYCKVQVNHRQYHTLWFGWNRAPGSRSTSLPLAHREKVNQSIQYGARLVQVANPPRHRR